MHKISRKQLAIWIGATASVCLILPALAAITGTGPLAVTQSGSWVLSAASAIIGKVGIDQTTPGTTNAVAATNFPTTADTNYGSAGASTLRTVGANSATSSTMATVTVATGGSYTDALTSSSTRRGCLIENPVSATETIKIFVGTTGSSHAQGFDVSIGGSYSCNYPGGVITENLDVEAATTGHTVVVQSW